MTPEQEFVLMMGLAAIALVALALALGLWIRGMRGTNRQYATRAIDQAIARIAVIERRSSDKQGRAGGASLTNRPEYEETSELDLESAHKWRLDSASGQRKGHLPTLIQVPNVAAIAPTDRSTGTAPTGQNDPGQHFDSIWALAEAGEETSRIAQTTGLPLGQVESVLGLRRQWLAQHDVDRPR